jgi:hypothetical protein
MSFVSRYAHSPPSLHQLNRLHQRYQSSQVSRDLAVFLAQSPSTIPGCDTAQHRPRYHRKIQILLLPPLIMRSWNSGSVSRPRTPINRVHIRLFRFHSLRSRPRVLEELHPSQRRCGLVRGQAPMEAFSVRPVALHVSLSYFDRGIHYSHHFLDRSNEELTPQLPVLSELPSLCSPLTEKDPALHRPASGSSLRNRVDFSGPSKVIFLFVSASALSHAQPQTPVAENILLVPEINPGSQPLSAVSMSSFGSLPSPLFDKAICDAFPSVPTDTPAQLPNIYFPRRGQGLTHATGVSADFDSALLSSAIHLAARNKAPASSDHAVPLTSVQYR